MLTQILDHIPPSLTNLHVLHTLVIRTRHQCRDTLSPLSLARHHLKKPDVLAGPTQTITCFARLQPSLEATSNTMERAPAQSPPCATTLASHLARSVLSNPLLPKTVRQLPDRWQEDVAKALLFDAAAQNGVNSSEQVGCGREGPKTEHVQ